MCDIAHWRKAGVSKYIEANDTNPGDEYRCDYDDDEIDDDDGDDNDDDDDDDDDVNVSDTSMELRFSLISIAVTKW